MSCAQLYQAGSTIREIMKALRIGSRETVYRYLKKEGIVPMEKSELKRVGEGYQLNN
ncbi:helix-turn-helix domain-containing protein (plasmid) [Bacteroides fragilis]|nr:helix-turn-helix domain-containing protein [Bacteroides fragilis]